MNAPQTVSWSPRRQLHKERNARSRLPCSTWNNALWTALRLISLKLTTEGCSWQVRRALRNTVLVSKETATGLSLGGRCRRCCSSAPTTYSYTGRKNVTECHGMSRDVTGCHARAGAERRRAGRRASITGADDDRQCKASLLSHYQLSSKTPLNTTS